LTLNDSGNTLLGGAVGGAGAAGDMLSSLTTDALGMTAINGGGVRTSGAQTYGDAVTLGADATLAGSTITTQSTLTGNTNALTITGKAVLGNSSDDTVSGLSTLSISGTTAINTAAITSTGTQSYAGAVTLGADTTLSGADLALRDAVKSDGTPRSLTVNDSGNTLLGGAVGGAGAAGDVLSSLTTDALGTAAINGGSVRTSGAQIYGDALTLGASTTLEGSTVTTLGTVTGNANALTVTGQAVLGDGAADVIAGLSRLVVSGTAAINTGGITTTESQTFNGAVTLGTDVTLIGVGLTLTEALSSDGIQRALAIHDSGTTTLAGAVGGSGSAGQALRVLTTDAAGITAITGGSVRTSGSQTYGDGVALGADTQMSGAGIATLGVIGATGGGRYALRLDVGSGEVVLAAALGADQGLKSLEINAGRLSTQALTVAGPIVLSLGTRGDVDGAITGSGASLRKIGPGTLSLNAASSYSGATEIEAGVLTLTKDGALGGGGAVSVAADAVLELQNTDLLGNAISINGGTLAISRGVSTVSGPVRITANSLFEVQGERLKVSGPIDAGDKGLALEGSGAFELVSDSNRLSLLATQGRVGPIKVGNSTDLTIGTVDIGAARNVGLSSAGSVLLRTQGELTLSSGATIQTDDGAIVLEAGRLSNLAGEDALRPGGFHTWQVWSTNPAPFDPLSGDKVGGLRKDYVQYDAQFAVTPTMGAGNALLYRYAPALTVALVGSVNKRYDANTDATLVEKNYSISGEVNGDSRTLSRFDKGVFSSNGTGGAPQNAGAEKVVTVDGLIVTAKTSDDLRPVYGYRIISPSGETLGDMTSFTTGAVVGSIDPAPLDLTMRKVYDGNVVINGSNPYELTGMVASEIEPRIVGGVASIVSPKAGNYKFAYTDLPASTLVLNDPNYTLEGGSVYVTIQKAPLGIAAEGNYSGSTEIKPNVFTVVGLVADETLTELEKFWVNVREVSANDVNFVTELVKAANGGSADLENYALTLAPNKASGTSQNTVRIKSLATLIVDVPAKPVFSLSPLSGSSNSSALVPATVDAVAAAPGAAPVSPSPAASGAPRAAESPASSGAGNLSTIENSVDTPPAASADPLNGGAQASAGPDADATTMTAPAAAASDSSPAAPVRTTELTPGVRISVITQAATGSTGLVAVVLPQGAANAGSPVVLSLPEAVLPQAAAGASAQIGVTLVNDRPLPSWIRFDAQQKVLVIESTAATSLPVTVLLTIDGQRTSIVVTESTTASR
jgi:autotransporter-associated beta strand protein